jgi:hypothetical protein
MMPEQPSLTKIHRIGQPKDIHQPFPGIVTIIAGVFK